MAKKIFWVVVLLNVAAFAYLQWGGMLTQGNAGMQPPLHADQIKLLGFSPPAPASAALPASTPASAQSAPPVVNSASAPASAPAARQTACLEWGEFSGADLAHASDNLATLKLGSRLSQREVEHSIGYWVYIPPLKKHSDINKRIERLKKKGITDFFIVQEKGKWQNAISLGIFKTEDLAQRFLDDLKSKGIRNAVMGERQTRLKFTLFVFDNPDAATLSKLAGWQKTFTGIEMKSVACNQAAER